MKFLLTLIIIFSPFIALPTPSDDHFSISNMVADRPDILYFSDTNHRNLKLLSVYTGLVRRITAEFPEYDCLFLETDREMFQPAIDDYMNNTKSWEDSVGLAQTRWEELTDRNYQQAPEPFLKQVRELGLNVFAVDWSDDSPGSKLMKSLFDSGFKGNMDDLREAFHWGVEIRNSVMAKNISELLKPTGGLSANCTKAITFIGGLHLATQVNMPMGPTSYTSVASYLALENDTIKQSAHEVLDCNKLNSISSAENQTQCTTLGLKTLEVPDLFNQGATIPLSIAPSSMNSDGANKRTDPPIIYNIMISPEN